MPIIQVVQRRLPRLQDGHLRLVALRSWAAEFDELSEGEQNTAEEFIAWLQTEARRSSDLARDHMTAGALRRWAKAS